MDPAFSKSELEKLGDSDATQCLVVGSSVYDPLTFAPKVVRFSRAQYVFLNAYRIGVTIESAAAKAGISTETALRFLEKPLTVAWLQDRALKEHIKNEWEVPGKWYQEVDKVYHGQKEVDRIQWEALKEIGDRVAPKQSRNSAGGDGQTRIEINIDPGAVQAAFIRQTALEAEVVNEPHL